MDSIPADSKVVIKYACSQEFPVESESIKLSYGLWHDKPTPIDLRWLKQKQYCKHIWASNSYTLGKGSSWVMQEIYVWSTYLGFETNTSMYGCFGL